MIPKKKLDTWIENNMNVLLIGEHGVGKSSIIIDAFDRHELKWRYFSGATLDPWVDFVGVPKEVTGKDGQVYLDLIRPKDWQDGDIEAIFMDEYNRSHSKVRNALMELIQFKSINGKKFPKLRMIWAAVNPDSVEGSEIKYDVEKADPAQLDRFHVHFKLNYAPDKEYFIGKYGEVNGIAAIEWWKELKEELKKKVSPRRLDYALEFYTKSGDLRDILPQESNVIKLIQKLASGPIYTKLQELLGKKDSDTFEEEASKFFGVENNYAQSLPYVLAKEEMLDAFVPIFDKERVSSLITSGRKSFREYIKARAPLYVDVLKEMMEAKTNTNVSKFAQHALMSHGLIDAQEKINAVNYPPKYNSGNAKAKEADFLKFRAANPSTGNVQNQMYYNAQRYNNIAQNIAEGQSASSYEAMLIDLIDVVDRTHVSNLKNSNRFRDIGSYITACIEQLNKKGYSFSKLGLPDFKVKSLETKLGIFLPIKQSTETTKTVGGMTFSFDEGTKQAVDEVFAKK